MIDLAEYVLVGVNLILGLTLGFPLARRFSRLKPSRPSTVRLYMIFIGVYFLECIAFMAGMATNIPGVFLAVAWGLIIGFWVKDFQPPAGTLLKTVVVFSIFTSLPAVSFILVPVMMAIGGWPVHTVDAGARFGIPGFVPWPINTILGFSCAVAITAVVFKTTITAGEVSFVVRFVKKSRF